ncbi:hypothetical protein K0M31_016683 [Melipona bicolor]|uniref:Uncharacterized protein n=1 Tax=Melipona bicolor TaxID=60889 RepID=A0AA40FF96_9HYME|nr:hypothetical protein K0M31_016683 [Melipona bicolor]
MAINFITVARFKKESGPRGERRMVVSSMDAMKYSMEADKYRAAYMPPSTLAMSMYSDPKYLDSNPKSYLDRSYLDSAKAYFEQSKLYMDQKPAITDYNRPSYEHNKLYDESSPSSVVGGGPTRSPAAESPDMSKQHERTEHGSSSASSTSTSSAASPGASLPAYYPGPVQTSGLLGPQMSQYSGYQTAPTPGNESFRRPLTVIF